MNSDYANWRVKLLEVDTMTCARHCLIDLAATPTVTVFLVVFVVHFCAVKTILYEETGDKFDPELMRVLTELIESSKFKTNKI